MSVSFHIELASHDNQLMKLAARWLHRPPMRHACHPVATALGTDSIASVDDCSAVAPQRNLAPFPSIR